MVFDREGSALLNYLVLLIGQFYLGMQSALKMQLCRIQTLEDSGIWYHVGRSAEANPLHPCAEKYGRTFQDQGLKFCQA